MSVINSQPLIGASGNQSTAYNLTRSLRFRSSASAYLNRTPASSGNRTTWTMSIWFKRGTLSTEQHIFEAASSPASANQFYFNTNDTIVYNDNATNYFTTTQVFRDPSAWYHMMVVWNTGNATASDRIRLYINGSRVTSFSSSTNPSLNATSTFNDNVRNVIGQLNNLGGYYFDGYMAEINFIDGQALTPSDFGETDTATGVWKPKKYTGTYGTNGFYLKFDNLTSTSTLGNDSSGNGNTWTVNNISLTSGSTYDSMKDVPTLTDADTANYCVVNPLKTYLSPTISNGNLQGSIPSGATAWSTMAVSTGKWYFEATVVSSGDLVVGVIDASRTASDTAGYTASGSTAYVTDGRIRNNNSNVGTYATYTTGDVIGVAFDCDAPSVSFYKNNTLQATVTPTSGITYTPQLGNFNAVTGVFAANFGQRPFAYTPPSGYKALNTFNLPTPTIGATASTQANDYFDVTTYTGTGSSQSITNSGSFQPDFVWIKNRTAALDHRLVDAVRGTTKEVYSSTTGTEGTDANGLTAFNSNGFTVGSSSSYNGNTNSIVAWQWKANGAGSSNTAGTITSTVSANTTAGFSIVTYTGNGTTGATVGHGLGVAPSMIIAKSRGAVTSWPVYHASLGATSWILLNSNSGSTTSSQEWNNTAPTSTVFTIGSSSANSNQSATYVAYCFAEVAGYSKFGSYTGNGSSDGPFVFTGFRPKFVMYKKSTGLGSWFMFDSARGTFNLNNYWLQANTNEAEQTDGAIDLLSNGFKQRASGGGSNTNGDTFIYAAFAESPFKYSLAR